MFAALGAGYWYVGWRNKQLSITAVHYFAVALYAADPQRDGLCLVHCCLPQDQQSPALVPAWLVDAIRAGTNAKHC
jgi:hypothetical protein